MPKAIRVEKTCGHCGQTFLIKPSHSHQSFCSRQCRNAHESVHGRPAAQAIPVEFTCQHCGGAFSMKPAYVTEYRKKFGKDPMYCSTKCAGLGRRARTEAESTFICEQCGQQSAMSRYEWRGTERNQARTKYHRAQRFCSQACKVVWQTEEAARRFRRGEYGRHIKRGGYVSISVPSLITGKKHEVLEHRYAMEQHLGRPLRPDETVHHIDGNRQHNDIRNLELFSSRHGPGQRVVDKIAFAIEMLTAYPEFTRQAGFQLKRLSIMDQMLGDDRPIIVDTD